MTDRLSLHLTGTAPLLMHNTRLADPSDPLVREMKTISAKRKKSDEDHSELARLEFMGGLYLDSQGPIIPGQNVYRALVDAARITREGKIVERGILLVDDAPLHYTGPRSAAGLWDNQNFVHRAAVKVTTSRVFRTRPQFREWQAEMPILFDPNIIEVDSILRIAETAGVQIGLGDWRPRFGRFDAIVKEN